MCTYIVKEKGTSPTSFICSAPRFNDAVRLLRSLEHIDKEMGEYREYGIIQREYCPVFAEECPNYNTGICFLRYPDTCERYKGENNA